MDTIVAWLGFFATSTGLTVIGVITAAVVIVWDWRLALAGLFIVQLGVAVAAVVRQGMPAEWGGIMVGVMALAATILALSARQTHTRASLYQSGTWPQRGLMVLLVYASWRLLDWHMTLPEIAPELSELFFWLGLCVLMILGMSENPLFTALAILLWLIVAQAVTAIALEIPALAALVGMIQLLAALACSYLILVEEAPAEEAAVITDITFPAAGVGSLAVSRILEPATAPSPLDWLREHWPTHFRRAAVEKPNDAHEEAEDAPPPARRQT